MDYLLVQTQLREINLMLNNIFSHINNNFKSLHKSTILEVGIGNGYKSIPIANKYKFKEYYGIESHKKIYDFFIETSKIHSSNIISYNENLEEFAKKTKIKFNIILFICVIHFIDLDNLIELIKPIIKQNGFIIIQNPHAKPQNLLKITMNMMKINGLNSKNN